MASEDLAAVVSDIAVPDMQKFLHEGLSYDSKDSEGLRSALKVSSEVDMTLDYSSEKLSNLENLLSRVLARENDIGTIDIENDEISSELIEKALTSDVLYTILSFELRELDNLIGGIQDLIVDVLRNMSSGEQPTEVLPDLVRKLHGSEELLKQSQERILEMKIQLAKLQMNSFSIKQNEWKQDLIMSLIEEIHLPGTELKPQMQTVEQRRMLRILEKSLAREVELEKKLKELEQNEKDLKSKMRLVEQVAACMEEAAEVAWGRFLEADNTTEVLTGISKDMVGKLQFAQNNLGSLIKNEKEINLKLQDCINQLNVKEALIQKLNSSISVLIADNSEVKGLREKVQILEEKLKATESDLKEANDSNETSQQQLKEMEGEIESLRESLHGTEDRARSAEEKVSHLTDSNLELTEEVEFLKGSNDSNTKKVSLLEKELRELDIQLQHVRASSEASQEQQNMLYSAIWDMETLIDELKQKVAKADSKNENAEERCSVLSERNSELEKELDFLRSRMEGMETDLGRAALEKKSSAKEISMKTSLIMGTVMQLAVERDRLEKQMVSLTMANQFLREKLQKEQKHESVIWNDIRSTDDKGYLLSGVDSADIESANMSMEAPEISLETVQVERSIENGPVEENGASSPTALGTKPQDGSLAEGGKSRRPYVFVLILLLLLLSILSANYFHGKLAFYEPVGS